MFKENWSRAKGADKTCVERSLWPSCTDQNSLDHSEEQGPFYRTLAGTLSIGLWLTTSGNRLCLEQMGEDKTYVGTEPLALVYRPSPLNQSGSLGGRLEPRNGPHQVRESWPKEATQAYYIRRQPGREMPGVRSKSQVA